MFEFADLEHRVAKAAYRREEPKLRERLLNAQYDLKENGRFAVLIVIAGVEGAGKGETIHLLNQWMDPRHVLTHGFADPSDEERERPHQWRYWKALPPKGKVGVFFGAWHSTSSAEARVMVERIEELSPERDWMRAYAEINDFELALARHDIVLVKYWLAISKDEQHRRFKQREKVAFKRFKITPEDWRNRKKWDAYESAVCDMVDRTSTRVAPWTLVEANNKYYARIKVLRTLCNALENALDKIE